MIHTDGWLTGCYLVEFSQAKPVVFSDFGTLRVEAVGHGYCASADLYHSGRAGAGSAPCPGPGHGIPTFPLQNYRFYLRGEGLRVPPARTTEDSVTLEWPFTVFEFTPESPAGPFIQRQRYIAHLREVSRSRSTAKSTPRLRLSGPVLSEQGQVVGNLSAQWLAPEFRTALLEILSLDGARIPRGLPDGLDWTAIFAQREVNWSVHVREQSLSPRRPGLRPASLAALAQDALRLGREKRPGSPRRPSAGHFQLLCVRQLEGDLRGVRFDWGAFDFPHPRPPLSTVVLSTGARPGRDRHSPARPEGDLRLRDGLHALGRALGLSPNLTGDGLMTSPPVVDARARSLPADRRFPPRIRWRFGPAAGHQLRHAPDIAVHPEGTCWRRASREIRGLLGFPPGTTGTGSELELDFRLSPPRSPVPLGAPVRLHFELANQGFRVREIPGALSLTTGHLAGAVTGPTTDPKRRSFRPFLVTVDGPLPRALERGDSVVDSLTLFRGPEGALFPQPGRYEVELTVEWTHDDRLVYLRDTTSVEVSPAPKCPRQNRLARRCLAESEILLYHLLPSDRWKAARGLLREVARSASSLRDHYAFTNARRAAPPTSTRSPLRNFVVPLEHLTPGSILAVAEFRQVLRWIEREADGRARRNATRGARLAECLRRWCEHLDAHDPELEARAAAMIRHFSAVGRSPNARKQPNPKEHHGQETPQLVGTRVTRGGAPPRQTDSATRMAVGRRPGRRSADRTGRVRP